MKVTIEWLLRPSGIARFHQSDDARLLDPFFKSLTFVMVDAVTVEIKGLDELYTRTQRAALAEAFCQSGIKWVIATRVRKDGSAYTKKIRVPSKRRG